MTPKQRLLLDTVHALTDRGVTPTYREITNALGLKSVGSVFASVQTLIEDGHLIATKHGRYRGVRPVSFAEPEALARMSRPDLIALRDAVDRRLSA